MGTVSCDCLIIGAGIAGAGLAAHLPRSMHVKILEREERPGYHSTGRSAAAYIESYGNTTIIRLNKLSAPFLHNPEWEEIDGNILSKRGHLLVAKEGEETELARHLTDHPSLMRLGQQETVDHFPLLRSDFGIGGAYDSEAYDIDVDKLHQGYLRRAKNLGTEIICKAEIIALSRLDKHWIVKTHDQIIHADIVVNASGAWADNISAMAEVPKLGIQPCRRSIAVIRPQSHNIRNAPLVGSLQEDWYAKPQGSDLLVSPADEDPIAPMDAYVDDEVLAQGLHRYEQMVSEPVTRVHHQWAGLRSFSPDRTPINGFDENVKNFFWLAGQGGYGIQTSPAMSMHAATLICGYTPKDMDLASKLTPHRFSVNS